MTYLNGKERSLSTGPLRYRLSDEEEKPDVRDGFPYDGIVLNVSNEGLCFITTRPLEEGQSIVIRCPWLMESPEEVTVRWCRKEAIDLWRIGVKKKKQ